MLQFWRNFGLVVHGLVVGPIRRLRRRPRVARGKVDGLAQTGPETRAKMEGSEGWAETHGSDDTVAVEAIGLAYWGNEEET